MSRRTTIVKQLRAEGINLLLVDGGDALFGPLPGRFDDYRIKQYVEKAKVIIAAYNRMEYAALAVGDAELGIGIKRLKELEKSMKFPLLCANIVDSKTGKPLFKPWAITKVGKIRIGLFGLIMNTLSKRFLERVVPGAELVDGVETGKKIAAELRPKVDLVIGLLHSNDEEIEKLLSETEDIDVVVSPHCSHGNHSMWIPESDYVRWWHKRPVLSADGQGSRLGRFDIALGEKGEPFVPWDAFQAAYEKKEAGEKLTAEEEKILEAAATHHMGGGEAIAIFPHFAEAPEIKAMVDRFKASTRFAPVKVEEEEQKAKSRFHTAEVCKECHEENYEKWRKTPHGRAYATLVKSGDEYRYDCLPCHTLGYGETFINAHKVGPYKDVQCENCHGTNPEHMKDPEKYTWPKVKEINCLVCHNPKHLGEPFNFRVMVKKDPCCRVGGK